MTPMRQLETDREGDPVAIARTMFAVGTAYDSYTSQLRRALSLNAHERLAISELWSRGPLTMTELGARIPLSRAAVTTLVDRLEGAGLVRRRGDVTDRRRTVVELASETIERTTPVASAWIADVYETVRKRSEEEWQAIVRFLEDMHVLNHEHAERLAQLRDDEIQELARAST